MNTTFDLLLAHGLIVVFLNVLAAQGGLPLPMLPLLILMGARSVAGEVVVVALFGMAVVASLTADLLWYAAGWRYGGRMLRTVCRLSISPDACVRQTQSLFSRWGVWTLLVAKFVPGLGPISTALSGETRVSISLFLLLDTLGASLYIGTAIGLGRIFHSAIDKLLSALASLGEVGFVVFVVALLLLVAFRLGHRQWLIRKFRMTRISVPELKRLIESKTPHAVYDARAAASRERDGAIPGALPWPIAAASLPSAAMSPEAEIVVYCDCPNEYSAAKVAQHLRQGGFTHVRPLVGGIGAWVAAGLPVERPGDASPGGRAPSHSA